MQNNNDNSNGGSSSMHKPSYFNSQIWRIIKNGPIEITKRESDKIVENPIEEWDDNDNNGYALNSKAINCIDCAVSADEFKKLSRCETAKEM